jgi:hypothetical protein
MNTKICHPYRVVFISFLFCSAEKRKETNQRKEKIADGSTVRGFAPEHPNTKQLYSIG